MVRSHIWGSDATMFSTATDLHIYSVVALKLTHSEVTIRFVDKPLVDFIHDAHDVPFDTQISDEFQLFLGENFPQWIVWRVDNDGLGATREFRSKFRLIQNPVG